MLAVQNIEVVTTKSSCAQRLSLEVQKGGIVAMLGATAPAEHHLEAIYNLIMPERGESQGLDPFEGDEVHSLTPNEMVRAAE